MSKDKFITLKEAAEISGYSPDYVGQLIRRGKLQGKQVFSNVSWMTTEEALLQYIEKNKKGIETGSVDAWTDKVLGAVDFGMLYKIFFGGAIALLAIFILFLIYIFSVSIDRHIERVYQQKIERNI